MSLMERLMKESKIYKKDQKTGSRNPAFITRLVYNFRSRRELIQTPSMMFYENELEALAAEVRRAYNNV